MAWNDVYAAGMDVTSITLHRLFWNAYNERARVSNHVDYPVVTLPSAGAAVLHAGVTAPASATGNFSIRFLQNYVSSAVALAGWASGLPDLNGQSVATYPGISSILKGTIDQMNDVLPGGWPVGSPSSEAGFTRKLPREFSTSGATTYANTTPGLSVSVADGHKARFIGTTGLIRGAVYERVAGAWVLTSNPFGEQPDLISTYGYFRAGDVVGPWIFNELRDMFNQQYLVGFSITGGDFSGSGAGSGSSGSFADANDAIADAEANYTLGSGAGALTAWKEIGVGWTDPTTNYYVAGLSALGSRFQVSSFPGSSGSITPAWKLYLAGEKINPADYAYDDGGTGINEGAWTESRSGTGFSYTEDFNAPTPSWPAPPTPPAYPTGTSARRGLRVSHSITIAEYLFTERAGV